MWKEQYDIRIFTGNATIKNNGCLVMGRGAAFETLCRFPNCDRAFGSLISHYLRNEDPRDPEPYGVLIHPDMHPILAIFQVKWHYACPAELQLIQYSTVVLRELATIGSWKHKSISMNFPGIGYGGLDRSKVLPIIRDLPDNVDIWEYR